MFEKISLQYVIFYWFWASLTYSNSNSKKFLSQLCTQLAYSWNVEKEALCTGLRPWRERPTLERKRVKCGHAIFLLTVQQIQMDIFSLKPSLSQGESSLKFQLAGVCRFGGVREQTNKLTHWQTDAFIEWLPIYV